MNAIVVVRAVHIAATVLTAGTFAFFCFVLGPTHAAERSKAVCDEIGRWLWRACAWSISLSVASWLIWLALVAASMSGGPLGQSLSAEVLQAVLTRTTFGQIWMLRFALMILLVGGLFLSRRRRSRDGPALGLVGACAAAGLLATLAWAGHAVGTEPSVRPVHLAADALHLLGAGLWLGALVPLLFVLGRASSSPSPTWHELAATATRRFSTLGVFAVATLLATGLINAWFLVGSFRALIDTPYGQLVSTKLALFVIIVSIAAFNRLKLTPQLTPDGNWGDVSQTALKRLWRNVIAEIGLGAIILAVVSGLGNMPPSFHKHGPDQHHMHGGGGEANPVSLPRRSARESWAL